MQVQRINVYQSQRSNQINKQNNSQPTFGMKFVIPSNVAGEFQSNVKDLKIASFIENTNNFLRKAFTEMIVHNGKKENHLAYDNIERLKKIDIKYQRADIAEAKGFAWCQPISEEIKEISLLEHPEKCIEIFSSANRDSFHYHLTTENGDTFIFGQKAISNNPDSINIASKMQEQLISKKTDNEASIKEDLKYLANRMESTAL